MRAASGIALHGFGGERPFGDLSFEGLVPEIVSGQVDVRPAERRDVTKKVRVWELAGIVNLSK